MIRGGRRREHELIFRFRSRLLRSGPKERKLVRCINREVEDTRKKWRMNS